MAKMTKILDSSQRIKYWIKIAFFLFFSQVPLFRWQLYEKRRTRSSCWESFKNHCTTCCPCWLTQWISHWLKAWRGLLADCEVSDPHRSTQDKLLIWTDLSTLQAHTHKNPLSNFFFTLWFGHKVLPLQKWLVSSLNHKERQYKCTIYANPKHIFYFSYIYITILNIWGLPWAAMRSSVCRSNTVKYFCAFPIYISSYSCFQFLT